MVPSLSKQATRCPPGICGAASRKDTTASRVAPWRHDGSLASLSVICSLSSYAPEAEVAGAGVHHLGATGRGPVAQAVGVGAQVGPALDHLAADPELRLRR